MLFEIRLVARLVRSATGNTGLRYCHDMALGAKIKWQTLFPYRFIFSPQPSLPDIPPRYDAAYSRARTREERGEEKRRTGKRRARSGGVPYAGSKGVIQAVHYTRACFYLSSVQSFLLLLFFFFIYFFLFSSFLLRQRLRYQKLLSSLFPTVPRG